MEFIRKNYFPISLFLVAFILRIVQVEVPINTDEVLWLKRGAAFMDNVIQGDFARTYLRHHPGVTNMWVIGTGWAIVNTLGSILSQFGREGLVCGDTNCLFSAWAIIRILQALVTSFCAVGIFILAKRLFELPIAIVATSLLVLEPFFLAYQRFITTDALQVNFSFLALLAFLIYLKGGEKYRWLIASGIFMGLAILSKIPAVFVAFSIPIWVVLVETGIWERDFLKRGWLKQVLALTFWGAIAGLTVFAIWPALWVSPWETIQTLVNGLISESNRGNLFFRGQYTDSPDGSFYPFVLALRLSPILQFGVIAFVIKLAIRPRSVSQRILALAIVPITALAILSLSSSKIDRYAILIIPELVFISTAGWLFVSNGILSTIDSRLARDRQSSGSFARYQPIMLSLLALLQALQIITLAPYFISYYNPLFGGIKFAEKILMIGQGEGLDLVGQRLHEEAQDAELSVCTWYSLVMDQYFRGPLEGMYLNDDGLRWKLTHSNRVVLYINQFQRQLPSPEILDYFSKQPSLQAVNIKGLDYALLYEGLSPLDRDLETIQVRLDRALNSQLKILGYNLVPSSVGDSSAIDVRIYWEFLDRLDEGYSISVNLLDRDNNVIASETMSGFVNGFLPLNYFEAGVKIDDFHHFAVDNPSDDFHVELALIPSEAS